jgi:elongation factor Ts
MSSLELIKKLRDEMGGIGMADCKKALEETGGNYEEAIAWLRKKGLANAAKKASRVASEGLVCVAVSGLKGALVEVNSETDFVAKNSTFTALVSEIGAKSLEVASFDALKTSFEEKIALATAGIGEKIEIRRMASVAVSKGAIAFYVHNATEENKMLGKIGVLIGVESSASQEKLLDLGKKIGMHIASCTPKYLERNEVSAEEIAKEKAILMEQASSSGKPQAVIEKMVEGRMSKFYSEFVLLEQAFVMNPDVTVRAFVESFAKEVGAEVKITAFKMMKLGEGIEKKEDNFAEEVAKMTSGK